MIAERVVLAEIPVQCKRKVCDWAVKMPFSEGLGEQGGPESFGQEVVDQEGIVLSDIGWVVEVPRDIKKVSVAYKYKSNKVKEQSMYA